MTPKRIKLIYGSAGGNTEIVCEKVANILSGKGFEVELHQAVLTKPEDLDEADLFIFASPTYSHGLLEQHFGKFLDGLKDVDLTGKRFAVIGLGDDKYDADYHMEAAAIITDFLTQKKAVLVHTPLKISGTPLPQLTTTVRKWAEQLATVLVETHGLRSKKFEILNTKSETKFK